MKWEGCHEGGCRDKGELIVISIGQTAQVTRCIEFDITAP